MQDDTILAKNKRTKQETSASLGEEIPGVKSGRMGRSGEMVMRQRFFQARPGRLLAFLQEQTHLLQLSRFKISCSHIDGCKFCVYLRNSSVRHVGMIEVTGLNIMASRSHLMTWRLY
jgi:hypothetical protein